MHTHLLALGTLVFLVVLTLEKAFALLFGALGSRVLGQKDAVPDGDAQRG